MPGGHTLPQTTTEQALLERIRTELKASPYSQNGLAAEIGISKALLSDIFNHKTPATFAHIELMCRALRLDMAVLIAQVSLR